MNKAQELSNKLCEAKLKLFLKEIFPRIDIITLSSGHGAHSDRFIRINLKDRNDKISFSCWTITSNKFTKWHVSNRLGASLLNDAHVLTENQMIMEASHTIDYILQDYEWQLRL